MEHKALVVNIVIDFADDRFGAYTHSYDMYNLTCGAFASEEVLKKKIDMVLQDARAVIEEFDNAMCPEKTEQDKKKLHDFVVGSYWFERDVSDRIISIRFEGGYPFFLSVQESVFVS